MREHALDNFEALKADDELWMDAGGSYHKFTEMEPEYIIKVYRMLKRNLPEYEKHNKTFQIPLLLVKRYNETKEKYPELFL